MDGSGGIPRVVDVVCCVGRPEAAGEGDAPQEPTMLMPYNAPTRGDLAALQILAENHIMLVTPLPHPTHVMQPIDVCWARSFKTAYRRLIRSYIEEEAAVRACSLLGPAARTSAWSNARDS
jgi:hypothetical protein